MQNYSPVYPYPNAYNQYVQTPVIPQQQNSNPIMAWVQSGMEGAKMYPVPLNSRAYLFDSEEDCFYVKVTDDMGRVTSFRKFKYEEDIVEEAVNNPNPEYVTKKDLEDAMRSLAEEIKNNNYRKGGHNNGKSFVRGTDESRDNRNVQ